MPTATDDEDAILTTADVARRFGVNRKTVVAWASDGKLKHFRTLGGQLRFRLSDVQEALAS